jgi:hypothetical protein
MRGVIETVIFEINCAQSIAVYKDFKGNLDAEIDPESKAHQDVNHFLSKNNVDVIKVSKIDERVDQTGCGIYFRCFRVWYCKRLIH